MNHIIAAMVFFAASTSQYNTDRVPSALLSSEDGLTRLEVQAVIRANLGQVRYCYEKLLMQKPNTAGKVLVSFKVLGTGRVDNAAIAESTIAEQGLSECLKSKISRWRFPQPRQGKTVDVKYPFTFDPNPVPK